jgi:hypothetical protein
MKTMMCLAIATTILAAGCGAEAPPACELGDASFTVTDHTLDGDVLTLDVEYAGGCADHEFDVWWGGALAPSIPPVLPLEVQHYSNGDSCEAIVTDTIAIDLSSLAAVDDELRIQIVVGEQGTQTLLEVLYSVADVTGDIPTNAIPIEHECGTIET